MSKKIIAVNAGPKEKKVEYLELIYDLIFVYIVGRNNSLLQHIEGGFVSGGVFLGYLLGTLAIIQIWNFSTFYINHYGRNGVRDHVFLFLNMFLLYFMGEATDIAWQSTFYMYSASWALILINIGIQYLIEIRNHREEPGTVVFLKQYAATLFVEAGLVGVHTVVYTFSGASIAYVPIIFGIVAMRIRGKKDMLVPVDFPHLSERAMLYVVFTFGEMIIVLAAYFRDEFTLNSLYFSTMAFIIVIGLLLSYGLMYNRLLDRERDTDGTEYMFFHVFLIFSLNNISASLEFMRGEEVSLVPKTVFLVTSFVLYFVFLFLLGKYNRAKYTFSSKFILVMALVTAGFAALMILLRQNMYLNIALSAVYVFGIFLTLYLLYKKNGEQDHI